MRLVVRFLQFVQRHMTSAALASGVAIGLIVGLAVGWWLWPVQLVNSAPAQLHSDFQETYLRCVADSYILTGDLEEAQAKLGASHWDEGQLVAALQRLAETSGPVEANRLNTLAEALAGPAPRPTPADEGEPEDEDAPSGFHTVALLCGAGILLVALAAAIAFLLPRLRKERSLYEEPEEDLGSLIGGRAESLRSRLARVTQPAATSPPPQFVTTYALGDDQYDPSFTIESDNGEFVGECGVGISETIGLGTPSKATAFEVWLFDKNDIRTVTAILMSDYAFGDSTLRAELGTKGEPFEARPGAELTLDTKTLRLHVRVAEAEYGAGPLPQNSYFSRLTVELSPELKGEQDAPAAQEPTLAPRF
jgi:hypothetical protein